MGVLLKEEQTLKYLIICPNCASDDMLTLEKDTIFYCKKCRHGNPMIMMDVRELKEE